MAGTTDNDRAREWIWFTAAGGLTGGGKAWIECARCSAREPVDVPIGGRELAARLGRFLDHHQGCPPGGELD